MRKLRYILYMLPVVLATVACSENAPDEPAANGNIQLGASVDNLHISSRVSADAYENNEPLSAEVWFRNAGGIYENAPDAATNLPIHTTAEFNGSQKIYVKTSDGKNLKYPTDNTAVHCVGMYPASGWTQTADKKGVAHNINGLEDLMFAPEITGNWNAHFSTQEYEHLLTCIKICVCASSHDAEEAWGTIDQITIDDIASRVTVDLPTGEYRYDNPQTIETITKTDGVGPALTTTNREVGSVFCGPPTKSDPAKEDLTYKLTVKATTKSGKLITRKLEMGLEIIDPDGSGLPEKITEANVGKVRGKCFVFSLYFTPDNVIEGTCALNLWNSQNEDIYIK